MDKLLDRYNDVWALGVMLHRVFTCANEDWPEAFEVELSAEERKAWKCLSAIEQDGLISKAIQKQQDIWVRCATSCCSVSAYCTSICVVLESPQQSRGCG